MDSLESIWNRVSQPQKDGKKYILFKDQNDLIFLYASGFVDAKKYKFDQWVDAFKSSLQKDGSYIITKEQWMDKKKYHYEGPIHPPFDPMKLEERSYTEKEIRALLKEKIIPSTIFDESYTETYINNLKAQGRFVGGKALIDKRAKEYILQVINSYPSPMRVLEVSVHGLLNAKKGLAKSAQGQLQKSAFSAGMTAQQITEARLAELTKSQSKADEPSSDKPAFSLKDLKKRSNPGKI